MGPTDSATGTDAVPDTTSAGPEATSTGPFEPPTGPVDTDGVATSGSGVGDSGGWDTSDTRDPDPTIPSACDYIASESAFCLTQTSRSWALVGLSSGIVCEFGESPLAIPEAYAAVAWSAADAVLCTGADGNRGLARTDPQTGEAYSQSYPCTHATEYEDELLVLTRRPQAAAMAEVYADFDAALAGDVLESFPLDVSATRIGAGEGTLYTSNDATNEIQRFVLGPVVASDTLILERGAGPISGLDRLGDRLFVLGDDVVETFDADTGEWVTTVDLGFIDPLPLRGLSCRERG